MTGLSLIELLVAMTIALVAILAATALYNSTRQTYRVQTMQNRLAEDGRCVISMLQRVITQAGFRPMGSTVAWTGSAIVPTSATGMKVRFVADKANQIDCSGTVVSDDTKITELVITGNTATGTLDCDGSAWIASAGAGTELVDFLLEYGSDTTSATATTTTPPAFGCGAILADGTRQGDCVADTYALPTAQGNPLGIVAVRACLVLRTDTTDASIDKSVTPVDCSGASIPNSQNDRKLYRTFRTTVLLRNRL
jgi:Tfp pilus assembly protein PilW